MLPRPIKYEWALISLYTTTIQYLAHDDLCQEYFPLHLTSRALKSNQGPFFKKRRYGWDFKELCFRGSNTPDQSLPVIASYKPFLGSGSCIVNKKQAVGLYFYSSCVLYVSILGEVKEKHNFSKKKMLTIQKVTGFKGWLTQITPHWYPAL